MPRVFISYSHDSVVHKKWVLDLAQRLRREGVDAWLDRFVTSPPEGWPAWMQHQIKSADYVVTICTPKYKLRFDGAAEADAGKGVRWEGLIARQLLYENLGEAARVVPIIEGGTAEDCLPVGLRPFTYYKLPGDYQRFYRHLFGQPDVLPEALGKPRRIPGISKLVLEPLPVRSQGLPVQPVEEVFAPEKEGRFKSIDGKYDRIELFSPLNCVVYHHAVICEKYGAECSQWHVIPVPNRPLDTADGEFSKHKTFLVLVERSTREALGLVSLTKVFFESAVPNETLVEAGDRIGSVWVGKDVEKNPWSVARGAAFQGVLKYQPRIEDGVWSPKGPSIWSSGIGILDSVSVVDSGVEKIRAPFAGIFRSLDSGMPESGDSIVSNQEVGQIERDGSRHFVRARSTGPIVGCDVRSGDAVHSGQALISYRKKPPKLALRMTLVEARMAFLENGWRKLLSPVFGKCSAVVDSGIEGPRPGNKFGLGEALCEIHTRNLRVQIATDSTGKVMETLVREGEDVEVGQALVLVRLESLIMRSPIVGTFYRSPEPGLPPFVEEGDWVGLGQVLCIIEAIKLKNEIEASISGVIESVFPRNGQPVEWGEPLFKIRLEDR